MAENKQPDKENNRTAPVEGSKIANSVGPVESAVLATVSILGAIWNAATKDGVLAAATRQGADELATALKAFPESIQVQETGTLWNPTQGEIAADRKDTGLRGNYRSYSSSSGPPHPWPSEIAAQNQNKPSNDHSNGHDSGHDAGHSM